jgi:hypothetical protein
MGDEATVGEAIRKDEHMVTLLFCSPLLAVAIMAGIVAKGNK